MKPIKQPARWDGVEELRKAIESTDELRALYAKLGYSPHLDRESQRILNEMKSLVRIEIPDFADFQRAVGELRDEQSGHVSAAHVNFFDDLFAVATNQHLVIEFLNRNPFDIPHMLLFKSSIRRRVSDPERLGKLLDELEQLLKNRSFSLGEQDRESLLSAVAKIRRNVQDTWGDLVSALESFTWAREEWLGRVFSYDDAAHQRKAQLDELLSNSLSVRYAGGQDDPHWHREAEKQAKTYLDSPWMHTPWLTTRVLTDLLDVELAPLSREAKPFTAQVLREPWATLAPAFLSLLFLIASGVGIYFLFSIGLRWAGWMWIAYLGWRFIRRYAFAQGKAKLASLAAVLKQVRDEVDSGNYDPEEIARRLRRHEQAGLYVHSLTYALLRLDSSRGEKERIAAIDATGDGPPQGGPPPAAHSRSPWGR